jgi:deoxycytidylate deaminase
MDTITFKDKKFIDNAIECCKKSILNVKHGAVLVSKGHIISKGFNHSRCKFGGSYKVYDKTFKSNMSNNTCCACHAEMDVLYKAILNMPLKSYLFKTRLKQQLVLQV